MSTRSLMSSRTGTDGSSPFSSMPKNLPWTCRIQGAISFQPSTGAGPNRPVPLMPKSTPRSGRPNWCASPMKAPKRLPCSAWSLGGPSWQVWFHRSVTASLCGGYVMAGVVPQAGDRLQELLRRAPATVGLEQGRGEAAHRRTPVRGEAEEGRPELLVPVAEGEDPLVARVLVGVHLEREGDPCALGDGQQGLHRVRRQRDLDAGDGEAELGGRLDLRRHVVDQLLLGEEAVPADADVGVDREGRGHEVDLGDEVSEPPDERVVELREAAEAREADDLESGSVAVGGDLADQTLEVVFAGVEGAREAVERDALDGGSEGVGHDWAAFMVLVSCSSMRSTPWSVTM